MSSPDPLDGYPVSGADEAVGADGRLREEYAALGPLLRESGPAGLSTAAEALAADRAAQAVTVGSWADGRQTVRTFPLDPVPRILPAAEWRRIAAGIEQRHRALNAFLADAYRAAGRRRSDPDRAPEVVRAGVLPEWAVAHSPGRDPDAVGQAWPGQPRATVAAADVLRTSSGEWVVTADHLQAPAGPGYALAGRESVRAAVPALAPPATGIVDPADALPLLRAGLGTAAPPSCAGAPRIAVLTSGESDDTWFEHRLLADALGVPLAGPGDLWPRADGGVAVTVAGERLPVDVLYRRVDDGMLPALRIPIGQSLDALLTAAVRAGRLGMANVPGNALADDVTTYAWVPQLIRFYLGEEPLLAGVPTWVLADDEQWAQARERLHELVVTPVAGYGVRGTIVGPACSATELAFLHAEVSAAPYRYVAREPVAPTTLPTLVDGVLRPRHVALRVLSVTMSGDRTTALPAPLTRVADGPEPESWWSGGAKDTWLLAR